MVFSRFFKDKDKRPDPASESDTAHDVDETESAPDNDGSDDSAGTPEQWTESTWAERAAKILPTGSSTGSKRPDALYGEVEIDDPIGPTHFVRAADCHIETPEGDILVDCTMALGAVAIGYGNERLTRTVLHAVGGGNVSGLASSFEVDVAENFCEFIPCAEKVQFLKTGAEAVSAAVRIARAYTNRDVVIGCGYFGWHDWASQAPGVPAATQQNYRAVPFDDVAALTQVVSDIGNRLAAIVIEPAIERMPSPEWIALARSLCDKAGAVLIFDEMKTGFRLAPGGYQEVAGVKPDLATFGKALANGFPLSAVCGRADLMDVLKRTWVSSTLASEVSALAAAHAVLEMHRESNICETLAEIGREMRRVVDLGIETSGVTGVTTDGIDTMWLLRFDTPQNEARFLRAAVRNGALFKRGAYNYAALAHDESAIMEIESAASNAFVEVRRAMERE